MGLRLKKGIWYYRSRMIEGRRVEISLKTNNLKDAERAALKEERKFYAGTQGWAGKLPTWEGWKEHFLATYGPRYKDAKGFLRVFKHTHVWRAWKISALQVKVVEEHLTRRLAEGAPVSTVGLERRLLRVIFQKAVDEGVLEMNPVTGIPPTHLKVLPRMRVLTTEEEALLMAGCRKERLRKIIRFFLITGLRADELLKATPTSLIQLPKQGIRVVGKGMKIRVVPLSPEAWEIAQSILPLKICHRTLLLNFENAALRAGLTEPSKGKRRKDGTTKSLKANVTLHDLRRTYATRCAEKQYPIDYLAKLLGHASIGTTAKYYTHLTPTVEADALMRIWEDWATNGAKLKTPAVN